MVASDRAMMLLSSLTASVTLGAIRRGWPWAALDVHELIGLLLLLEDRGRGIVLLRGGQLRSTRRPLGNEHS